MEQKFSTPMPKKSELYSIVEKAYFIVYLALQTQRQMKTLLNRLVICSHLILLSNYCANESISYWENPENNYLAFEDEWVEVDMVTAAIVTKVQFNVRPNFHYRVTHVDVRVGLTGVGHSNKVVRNASRNGRVG